MSFKTEAEAYNYYKEASLSDIEKRASEIKELVSTDSSADVQAFNIELKGLAMAKESKETQPSEARSLNPITGASFEMRASEAATTGDVYASPEYRTAFYKTLQGKELNTFERAAMERARVEKRADAFNTVTDAAAVIPTQTLNEVISKARTMGGLLGVCRSFAMPSNIAIPVGTPASKAAWHTEGAVVDSDEATVAAVSFGAFEIMKVFSISAATKRMSIAAFEAYLTNELLACVMECIADALVNGTGSNQGKGVSKITFNTSNKNLKSVSGTPTYADIVGTVAMLKRGYSNNAKWAMCNADLYNYFYGLTDDNGRPIFIADAQNDKVGKLLGFEVVVDDNIASGSVFFGNFDYMGYNLAEGVAIETSTQSSFKNGLIDYRALAIADCKPIVEEAFIKMAIAEG